MSVIEVAVSRVIPTRPETVYAVLADYRVLHPAILPKKYFEGLNVLSGGNGAGTLAEIRMNVFGAARVFLMEITEPEPGRLLKETDTEQGVETLFKIEPKNNGNHTEVTIISKAKTNPGLVGVLERLMSTPIYRSILRAELDQLALYLAADGISS